jgi:hypothetical protein
MGVLGKSKTNHSRNAREIVTPCVSCPVGVVECVHLRTLIMAKLNVQTATRQSERVYAVEKGDEKL